MKCLHENEISDPLSLSSCWIFRVRQGKNTLNSRVFLLCKEKKRYMPRGIVKLHKKM